MSGTGEERGFTLLELLVALAILTLLTLSIPIALPRLLPAQQLGVDAQTLAAALRDSREDAVLAGREARLLIDNGELRAGGQVAVWRASNNVEVRWASDSAGAARELGFYADGSSSGGRFELRLAGREAEVVVSSMTGRVSVGNP